MVLNKPFCLLFVYFLAKLAAIHLAELQSEETEDRRNSFGGSGYP